MFMTQVLPGDIIETVKTVWKGHPTDISSRVKLKISKVWIIL